MAAFVSGLIQGGSDTAAKKLGAEKTGSTNSPQKPSLLSKLGSKIRNKFMPKGPQTQSNTDSPLTASPITAKRGARKVRKTGTMLVHKGESVLTKRQAKRYRRRTSSKR